MAWHDVLLQINPSPVTDDSFAETREQLGGYFLIDARDLNEAIHIAGRLPTVHKSTVEIRPIVGLKRLQADSTESP